MCKKTKNQQWQLINPAEYILSRKGWKHVQYIDLNRNLSFFLTGHQKSRGTRRKHWAACGHCGRAESEADDQTTT